jgi:TPR repeat protein
MSNKDKLELMLKVDLKDPQAAFKIANYYNKGIEGFKKNKEKAMKHMKFACEKNVKKACNELARLYVKNNIEDNEISGEFRHLCSLKKGGYPCLYLAKHIKDGPRKKKKQEAYLKSAAKQGCKEAFIDLASLYKNNAKKKALFLYMCKQDYYIACYKLSKLYIKNKRKKLLLDYSCKNGVKEACSEIRKSKRIKKTSEEKVLHLKDFLD